MSLPSPSTTRQSYPDPNDFQEFEQPLMELARRSKGDLRRLLTAFFGFLHRRTDFYCVGNETMGFPMGDAEKLLLASFRQFPLRNVGVPPPSPSQHHSAQQPAGTATTFASSNMDSAGQTVDTSAKAAVSLEEAPKTETIQVKTKECSSSAVSTVRLTDEGLQVPIGNGGMTDRYQWTQTLEEVTMIVPVDATLRGRDLDVSIAPNSLSIKTKQPLPNTGVNVEPKEFVSGILSATVDPNESTWSLEGGVVQVILYKTVKTFWSRVMQEDPQIDTDLVDNRREIHSYDEATQAKLRQVMFDQQQMTRGLPTSDQIQKKIPPLPPGVEFISQEVLDKNIPKDGKIRIPR